MSKITNDGLTRSGTGFFICPSCTDMATVAVKELRLSCSQTLITIRPRAGGLSFPHSDFLLRDNNNHFKQYKPKSETVAGNGGINVGEPVITNCSPLSIVVDFQTSLGGRVTPAQSDCAIWTSAISHAARYSFETFMIFTCKFTAKRLFLLSFCVKEKDVFCLPVGWGYIAVASSLLEVAAFCPGSFPKETTLGHWNFICVEIIVCPMQHIAWDRI